MSGAILLDPKQAVVNAEETPPSSFSDAPSSLSLAPTQEDGSFNDLAKLKQKEAYVHQLQVEIETYQKMFHEAAFQLEVAKKGRDTIKCEYQRRLDALRKDLTTIDYIIDDLLENNELQYTFSEHAEEVQVLLKLRSLLTKAEEQIQERKNEVDKLIVILDKKRSELGTRDPFCDVEDIEGFVEAFLALSDNSKMAHLLWLALGKPDPKTFDPKKSIVTATPAQIRDMSLLYQAVNKLQAFRISIQTMENGRFDKDAVKHHWSQMTSGGLYERTAGRYAQQRLMQAVWILKGMAGVDGHLIPPQMIEFENTIGLGGWALFEGLHRMIDTPLSFFRSPADQAAITAVFQTLRQVHARDGDIGGIVDAAPLKEFFSPLQGDAQVLVTSLLTRHYANKTDAKTLDALFDYLAANTRYCLDFLLQLMKEIDQFENPKSTTAEIDSSDGSDEKKVS